MVRQEAERILVISDSSIRTVASVLGIVGLFVAGAAFGNWLAKPTIDDLVERNRILYESDSLKAVMLEDTTVAYERLVFDVRSAKEALRELGVENEALAAQIASQGLTIRSLLSYKARLEYELETALSNVSVTDTLISAEIQAEESYDSGKIEASGEVRIDPRVKAGSAVLKFFAETNPVVTFSRNEQGVGVCDLTFGDMPVTVDRLHCVDNLGYETPTRKSLFGSIPNVLVTSGIAVIAFISGALLVP